MKNIQLTQEFSLVRITCPTFAQELHAKVKREDAPRYLKKQLSREEFSVFLVESYSFMLMSNQEIAGIVSLYQERCTGMWLTSLLIFSDFRGRGLASLTKHGIYHIGFQELGLEKIFTRFRVSTKASANANYNVKHCGCQMHSFEDAWYEGFDIRVTVCSTKIEWELSLSKYKKYDLLFTSERVLDAAV